MNGGSYEVRTRWQDLDGLGHVNHAVVFTYLEEARDAFLRNHGIGREEYVVGRCSVEFRGEIAPGIRTGLEDVAYLSKGVLAPSNAALVEMAVGLAKALGREVATQEQTKELLSLG